MINRTSWCHFEDSMYIFLHFFNSQKYIFVHWNQHFCCKLISEVLWIAIPFHLALSIINFNVKMCCSNPSLLWHKKLTGFANVMSGFHWLLLKWFVWCSLSRWILIKYLWTLIISCQILFFYKENRYFWQWKRAQPFGFVAFLHKKP